MSKEVIWKDIPQYEGIYEVSNDGRVRTHKDKKTWSSRYNTWREWGQRELKEKNPKGRDVRVSLYENGKEKSFLVHRLVAFAFIPRVEGKDCINHIDGNPRNNNVENLEWCNHTENNRHAFENNLIKTGMKIKLIHVVHKIEYEFNSMTKAGEFLNRSHSYISDKLKKGIDIVIHKNGEQYQIIKLT